MKKFTKLWQLMMVLLLTSSVAFAQVEQTTSADKNASKVKLTKEQINTLIDNGVITKEDVKTGEISTEVMEKVGYKSQDVKEQLSEVDPNPAAYQMPVEYIQPATQAQGEITTSPVKPVKQQYQSSNSEAILYSQMTAGANGGSCQNFEPSFDIYDAWGADDFTVTGGPWNVQTISWYGSYSAGGGPINSYNIEFFADNAGMPGASIALYPANFAVDNSGLFTSWLPAPLVLNDGTYWISIQADADYATYGQFFWTLHDPTTTYPAEAVWQNPLDGFGTGYTTWTGVNTVWPGFFDFTFELSDDPPPLCADPSGVLSNNYTTVSADIDWTENGIATLWDLEWGTTGFTPGTGTLVTGIAAKPYTLGGLSTGVDYDVYVRSDCGGGNVSNWVGPYTFRLPDYFGTITPTITCQTDAGSFLAGGKAWYAVSMDDNYEYNFSCCNLDVTCPGDMPVADADFTFYDTDGATMLWYIDGASGCGWDATTWGSAYESWVPPATGTYYLQVDDYYNADPDNFILGYISAQIATCPAPTTQTATNITTTSADLGWTETGTAVNWEIELGVTGFTPTGTGTAVAVNPYPWGGLVAGTTYDWYVRAVCHPTDMSLWTGPHTFSTLGLVPDLLYQFDVEAIGGDNRNLGVEFFNGSLWVTDANTTLGNQILEIDPYTSTLLNSYPQGTTTTWGMRDMANDGALLYASDENGFYSINPGTGVVTTVFPNTAPVFAQVSPLRALAYDGTNFWAKSFGGVLICFDIAGNVVAGPFAIANSAYGMAYDPTVPCLWLHATGGATGNEMVQVDMAGNPTGQTIPVPVHPCGPAANAVGGAFMDFGNMYTGRDVFGVLDQTSPDVVKIFTAYDTGFPGQTFNFNPACGASSVPVDGTLTWDFGANTDTYDLWFGPAGAMVQVVTGGAAGATGSYVYSGLAASTNYEWRVDGYNTADLGPTHGLVYNFTTACGTYVAPFYEDFLVWPPTCWDLTGGSHSWIQYVATGVECAEASFWGQTSGSTDVMTTPLIDISGLTDPGLWFDWSHQYNASYPTDQMEVFVSDDGGTTWTSVWFKAGTDLDSGDGATSTTPGSFVQSVYIDLSAFGSPVLVQFYATSGYGPDLFVDNVYVDEIPQCPAPSGQNVANVAPTSADLGWTENGTATAWEIELGITGFTPTGTGTAVVTNPYTWGGLTAGTTYDWYVRADCGTSYSIWTGPHTFTTPNAITIPYAFGFEVNTKGDWSDDPSTDDAWDLNSGSTSSSGTGPASAYEGDWYVYTETSTGVAGRTYGLIAYFDFAGVGGVNFNYAYSMYGATMGTLELQVSTDYGANYNTEWTLSGDQGTDWHLASVDLSAYAGMSDVLVRFLGIRGTSYTGDMAVDAIDVFEPVAHDVSTLSIDIPNFMGPGTINPQATVYNNGMNTETFDVQMDITGGYTSTVTVVGLAPLTSQQVTFAPWAATSGDYLVDVCTQLVGDMVPANDCIYGQPVFVRSFDKVVYAYKGGYAGTIPEGPFSFNLNNPTAVTSIADQSALDPPYCGTWANGFWWAANSATFDLFTLNPTDGARTIIGNTGMTNFLNGMAFDATTGTMYGIDGTNLYTIDMTTGAATIVAAHTLATSTPVNLACSPGGVLYTVGLSDDILYTVDKATAVGTAVGPVGYNINYAQDMEFDLETGDLFMAAYGGGGDGNLRWVDTSTGMSYFIDYIEGPAGSGIETVGFAIPYGYNITGNITYDNGADNTAMDNSTAILQAAAIRTDITGCAGDYDFFGLADGTYTVTGQDLNKPWGGLSMNDVQLARQHVAGTNPLTGIAFLAADVTWDDPHNVAMNDVQLMRQRVAGTVTSFPAPDYVFETFSVVISGADAVQDILTLCAGDVDGSYIPPGYCPDPTNLGAANITGVSADLTWTSNSGVSNLEWGTAGFTPGTGTLVTGVTSPYNLTGLSLSTSYDFYVQDECCGGVYTSAWVGPYNFTTLSSLYCPASGGCDEYIDGVVIGTISNLGTGCTNYGDYTALSTDLTQGAVGVSITITNGNSYSSDDLGIWIDWNQDGDFDDAGENVVCTIDDGADGTYTFDVPAGATLGSTTMRIRIKWSGSDCGSPCGTTTYGEVEDYTVNVVP